MIANRSRLLYMSALTLFGMSALGVILISFIQDQPVLATLGSGKKPFIQCTVGLFYGSFSGLLAIVLIRNKQFQSIRTFFSELVREVNPSFTDIIIYSACAGIGEEILFRAGIQPLIGIWPAAILFVALHGYIAPNNLRLSIYGVFLVIIVAGFGYLFRFFGLYAAIIAHFVYDVSMFCVLRYTLDLKTVQKS